MKRVMVMGAAIVDVLVTPADPRVFEIGSCPADRIMMTTGGDALNEAIVIGHLGVPVHLETIVGDDIPAGVIQARMEQGGLDTSGLRRRKDLNTSVNVVLVQENGERSFLTDPHASQRQLSLGDISTPFPDDVDILSFASIFVFPKMGVEELAAVFRQAKAQGITVCADMTKCKKGETAQDMAPAFAYVDYLFGNDAETMMLTRTDSVEQAADQLLAAGAKTVVIKCGAKGCYVCTAEGKFWAEGQRVETCVDTTGAGDSFVGGFVAGLAQELSLEACVRQANACGAKAVQQVGAVTWTLNDHG